MVLDRQTKKAIIATLIIVMLAAIVQYVYVANTPKILEEKVFEAKAEIGNKGGIIITDKVMDFGRITPHGASQKEINVANDHDKEVLVIATVSGDIAEMIEIRPNYVTLKPKETTKLVAQFTAGNNTLGNYTGYVKIVLAS